ncbi:hypothetical protein ACFQRB_16790 [Halobaculum litoreum]|uniref:Uncharacterized protein n=2 Tax=Halobaculum litoreum TaxID=3031998 RepID=A0ABD5XZV7_9EURY
MDLAYELIESAEAFPEPDPWSPVNAAFEDIQSHREAVAEMSPTELQSYIAATRARTAALDTLMQGEQYEADVRSDVSESVRNLAESKSKSYAPFTYTPSETGLTLSDVSAPVGEHETTDLGNGIIERNGKRYRRLLNSTYDRID